MLNCVLLQYSLWVLNAVGIPVQTVTWLRRQYRLVILLVILFWFDYLLRFILVQTVTLENHNLNVFLIQS